MSEVLYSPVVGEVTVLENVNDEMFSEKMLGDGIAVIPHADKLYSPVNGTISMVYDTQHAIGILTDEGANILIHIGIDTVHLKGKPFKTKVKQGDKVKVGDLLTVVNWRFLKRKKFDVIVPIIVTDKSVSHQKVAGEIGIGDALLNIL